MEYSEIPEILNTSSMEEEPARDLGSIKELLEISYRLLAHPVLSNLRDLDSVDVFLDAMNGKRFDQTFHRTYIERTIMQAEYLLATAGERSKIIMRSKGIEYGILVLKDFLETANHICGLTEEEFKQKYSGILFFRMTRSGEVVASVKYFMEVCNDFFIRMHKLQLFKSLDVIKSDEEKEKFLLRKNADFLQMKDQFDKKVYDEINEAISIELNYYKTLRESIAIGDDIKQAVRHFLAEKKSRISNQRLLLSLLEDDIQKFQQDLTDLVLELFSFHDVGGDAPERVYHALLIGIFNDFKQHYKLQSNREAGTGRFDILLLPDSVNTRGLLIEVKRSESRSQSEINKILQEAIDQIVNNKYFIELKANGHKEFIAMAIAFYKKEIFFAHSIRTIE